MSILLQAQGLHAYYGLSHVLRGVDLHIRRGEIVSLLGRNGAGRSTALKALMGLVRVEGEVIFKGEPLLGLKPFQIARKGVGYVAESRDVFPALTVEENLTLGKKSGRPAQWQIADAYRLFPQLQARSQVPAGVLSGGEQQMLALCRCLMGDPELILVDEPTEGLAPQIVEQLASFLVELSQRGIAILLVEQKMAIALQISQRVYMMGHGAIVFEGAPEALIAQPEISRQWLGI